MSARAVLAGRYELRDRLGQGGMSVVWRARDLVLNRDVAVKMLAARGDERLRHGVRSEALAAARLAHPHVARVFDYGEAQAEDGRRTPYIVMEMLRGTPLSEAASPMPPRRAFQICAEIASALAAAHAQGVIHCDVKPSNVMLTAMGAKVFDFGIAATVAATEERSPIDEVIGTPAYLAPEQLTGMAVTPATDVYALCVLLYGLLTNEAPWAAPTEAAMAAARLLDDPHELPDLDGVTAETATMYRRCLARDPALRPAASELAVVFADAARVHSRFEPRTDALVADTVQLAPVCVQTALLSNRDRLADDWRRWRVVAMLLAAGSVAVAIAYTTVDVIPSHVWQVAQAPAPPETAPPETAPAETTSAETGPEPPPTTESTTPTTTPDRGAPGRAGAGSAPPIQPQTFVSQGGAIVVGCQDSDAYLISWTPTEGFKVKKLNPGPASRASLELRNRGVRVLMTATCRAGVPAVTIHA